MGVGGSEWIRWVGVALRAANKTRSLPGYYRRCTWYTPNIVDSGSSHEAEYLYTAMPSSSIGTVLLLCLVRLYDTLQICHKRVVQSLLDWSCCWGYEFSSWSICMKGQNIDLIIIGKNKRNLSIDRLKLKGRLQR